ncbi:unnamed protein product [Caenorhabditis nigoni]
MDSSLEDVEGNIEKCESRNDPSSEYRFCCKSLEIKKGAYAVAVVCTCIIISNLCMRAIKSEEVEWNWQLLFLVSDSIAVISLFYGIVRQNAAFLQPFTVLSIVTVSFCLLLSFFYLSAVIDPSSYAAEQVEIGLADKVQHFADVLNTTPQTAVITVAAIGSLGYACLVFLHSWFVFIVVRTAQYFRALTSL